MGSVQGLMWDGEALLLDTLGFLDFLVGMGRTVELNSLQSALH